MASTSALYPVRAAALAKLQADSAVTALVPVGRIVNDVPPRSDGQYISVRSVGEFPFDTMGGTSDLPKYGSVIRLFVRVFGAYPVAESDVQTTFSAVKACLHDQTLTVSGFPTVSVELQNAQTLEDTYNGVLSHDLVADFDVTVHQS